MVTPDSQAHAQDTHQWHHSTPKPAIAHLGVSLSLLLALGLSRPSWQKLETGCEATYDRSVEN